MSEDKVSVEEAIVVDLIRLHTIISHPTHATIKEHLQKRGHHLKNAQVTAIMEKLVQENIVANIWFVDRRT